MNCPWSAWPQSPASFCEAPLCAWIREPGNTWSNAGFLLVAAIFYRETARPEFRHLRAIAHITLLTGVGSMAFHATDTWLGAALDYAGMFLGGAFMLLICFFRWTRASRRAGLVFFWVLALAGGASFVLAPEAARWAYALEGIVCGLSEVTLFFTAARAEPVISLDSNVVSTRRSRSLSLSPSRSDRDVGRSRQSRANLVFDLPLTRLERVDEEAEMPLHCLLDRCERGRGSRSGVFHDPIAIVRRDHRAVGESSIRKRRSGPAQVDHVEPRGAFLGPFDRGNDGNGRRVVVRLVVRDHDAGARLSRLHAHGGIAADPKDVTPSEFHSRSASSSPAALASATSACSSGSFAPAA